VEFIKHWGAIMTHSAQRRGCWAGDLFHFYTTSMLFDVHPCTYPVGPGSFFVRRKTSRIWS
jgi:hypothetical protein